MRKTYKRKAAALLSAAVLAADMGGYLTVQARDITGENLVENPDFDDGTAYWTFEKGGTASNNGHTGEHFYLDGVSGSQSASVTQTIEIPADGIYEASVWIACAGTGGKFGIRTSDGKEIASVELPRQTDYTQYTLEGMELTRDTSVELYVTGGSAWINGDSFVFSCTEQTGDTDDTPEYVFEGNMVENPSFDENAGWIFSDSGYAQNNGHNGKGDRHFYINASNGTLRQQIQVPYTGYYKTGLWVASAGTGAKFGVTNMTTGESQETELATNTKYTEYGLEIWLNKGDTAEIHVTGGSGWVNGDDISLEYNTGRFENMAVNPAFEDDSAWEKEGAASVGSGSAVLSSSDDAVSQNIYIPQDGPYYAEVTFVSAENASISFAGETVEKISGSQTVKVKAADLKRAAEEGIVIRGKAEVTDVDVRFDLDEMPNTAPEASKVEISGDCTAELMLEASYAFADEDGHTEGNSEYQWFLADSADGEYQAIEGENSRNLVVRKEWEDKYLKFQVTPVDQYAKAGEPVQSRAVGPVDLNLVTDPGFESNGTGWSGISTPNSDAYAGLNRGNVKAGTTASQTITVPRSAYYDFEAYTRYAGQESGLISIQDENGNEIKSVEVNADEKWAKTEMSGIPLEEGQTIKLVLTGASDMAWDIDQISLKRDREEKIPAFMNVKSFVTEPDAFETVIDTAGHTVVLSYLYGTDLEGLEIADISLSEGAEASVKAGDVISLEEPFTFTVTGSGGAAEDWTVSAEVKEKKVAVESSNEYLEDTFNWAANKMEQFVMTGKTGAINVSNNNYEGAEEAEYVPSYWAGYYDRTAFYGRDFVHQATGGQIAGLAEENFSMFKAFAAQCTESRQWYTLWALNFDGSPYTVDYKNDNNFVREVPAQFELVEKAYEQYLWTGDERYITDETLWSFYTNVMTKYVDSHDENGNGVAQEVGTGIFNGSATYNERGRRVIEAGDAIGSQYQATLAYAGMLEARGESAEAQEWYQKAADLKTYFNEEWSVADEMDSEYVCAWGPDGERYSDFSKETSWFMPMKQITEPGERNDAYIDFILESLGEGIGDPDVDTEPNNIEAYTYIPDMLFPYNRSDDAWKWMKYITSIKDEPHERPVQGTNGDYPEISFTFVSHTIEGMMGVEPDAGRDFVATVPRLPSEVPDVTAKYMQVGDFELDLTHTGNTSSSLTNHGDRELKWEARFYGDYDYVIAGGEAIPAEQKEINGETVSFVQVTVPAGSTVNAQAAGQEQADIVTAAQAVMDQISAIGEVTLESRPRIEAARAAYDALSEEAKALVANLDVLEAAESRLSELEKGQQPEDPEDPEDPGDPAGPEGSDKPKDPADTGRTEGDTSEEGSVPKTGDPLSAAAMAAAAIVSAGTAGITWRLNKEKKKRGE